MFVVKRNDGTYYNQFATLKQANSVVKLLGPNFYVA